MLRVAVRVQSADFGFQVNMTGGEMQSSLLPPAFFKKQKSCLKMKFGKMCIITCNKSMYAFSLRDTSSSLGSLLAAA